MKEIYADFNDIAADGTLPLTCAGSVSSIAELSGSLADGEEVLFTDGELRAKGCVFRRADGTWEGRSDWSFLTQAEGSLAHPASVSAARGTATGGKWTWGRNAIPDSEAEAAYQAIRESTTDVAAISRYTGYGQGRLQRIKSYLFSNKEWTGADADIAGAWHRLRTGAGTATDRLLLKHETAEIWLRQNAGMGARDAHGRANSKWNWQGAIGQ